MRDEEFTVPAWLADDLASVSTETWTQLSANLCLATGLLSERTTSVMRGDALFGWIRGTRSRLSLYDEQRSVP